MVNTHKSKSVSFLLPHNGFRPSGGFKVVYEYANRLANEGYDVHIIYPATADVMQKLPFKRKIKAFLRFCLNYFQKTYENPWFNLDSKIALHYTISLDKNHLPDTDYYVATAVQTAYSANELNVDRSKILYLIQDFENWGVSDDFVYQSYLFGFKNIVISDWLAAKLDSVNAPYTIIKNGFDFNYFGMTVPIENKNPLSVSMLYHKMPRKGCEYGIKALSIIKEKYPQFKAVLFGVCSRPDNIPDWVEYFQSPDKETHNRIYNESAIYLAPSLQEGWGLTVGEAMICGAAVVCTDTLGFREMVTDKENGLIVPLRDSDAIVNAVTTLIENPKLRRNLALKGYRSIQSFKWDDSYKKLSSLMQ